MPNPFRESSAIYSLRGLRFRAVAVALTYLGDFFIEFAVAQRIGPASLFADSSDFFEDAAINALIFAALASRTPAPDCCCPGRCRGHCSSGC